MESPNKSIYGNSGINAPVGYSGTKAGIIGHKTCSNPIQRIKS